MIRIELKTKAPIARVVGAFRVTPVNDLDLKTLSTNGTMRLRIALIVGICLSFQSYGQHDISISLVADINPDPAWGSGPQSLYVFQDKLYLSAVNSNGRQLFVYDESSNVLTRLTYGFPDFNVEPLVRFAELGDELVFNADDDSHGYELWKTDGTVRGTQMIHDLYQGTISSNSQEIIAFENRVYFRADLLWGTELYVTDGTPSGTYMVSNIGSGSSYPTNFVVYNDKLFFSAAESSLEGDELWCTDGTEAGTTLVADLNESWGGSSPYGFHIYQDLLYFEAEGDSIGRELYVTDGTEPGTHLVMNINTNDPAGSFSRHFFEYNQDLYFTANDGIHGTELWRMNSDTIVLFKDMRPGEEGGMNWTNFHIHDGYMYFKADPAEFGDAVLFRTDGTVEGTREVFTHDSLSIEEPGGYVSWHGHLLFYGDVPNALNRQLWIIPEGESQVYRLFPDSVVGWSPFGGSGLVEYHDELYLSANLTDSIGLELYKLTDGPLSVLEPELKDENPMKIMVFPNPNAGSFVLDIHQNRLPVSVRIHDLSGKLVDDLMIDQANQKIEADLLPGVYLLSTSSKSGESSWTKIVVSRN